MPEGYSFSTDPAPEVLRYFEAKGLKPSFHWQDVWAEEHAFAFTVATATELDVLTTLHGEVRRAIAEGRTLEAFKADLEPRLRALGWWGKDKRVDPRTGETITVQLGSPRRLKTIYWANTRTAHAAGAWERSQRTKRGLPYLIYRLGPSEVHRPHHVAREGMVRAVDDPVWDAWYPPNGWGCKCWVRQITRTEADELGGPSDDPGVPDVEFVNKRTGERTFIPQGIDPGWHTNPGKSRARNLARFLGQKLDAAPGSNLARVAVADMVGSQAFRMLAGGEFKGSVFLPVAMLDEGLGAAIGSKTRSVFLSSDDAAKQAGARPDVLPEDYARAQGILDAGEIIDEGGGEFGAHLIIDGLWWRLALHMTGDRRELFMKSLRRSNPRQIDKYRLRGPRVR